MKQLPDMTLDESSELWQSTDYAFAAVIKDGFYEINAGDAAAFFLAGYLYARKQIAKANERTQP